MGIARGVLWIKMNSKEIIKEAYKRFPVRSPDRLLDQRTKFILSKIDKNFKFDKNIDEFLKDSKEAESTEKQSHNKPVKIVTKEGIEKLRSFI